jgi:hypothetical protein
MTGISQARSHAGGPSMQLSRRGFMGAAAALAAGLGAGQRSSASKAGVRLTLPPPTGRFGIGTIALHLVDYSRQDPFLPAPQPRELMISIWYPAHDVGSGLAPWIPQVAVPFLRAGLIPPPLVQVAGPGGIVGPQPGPPLTIPLDAVYFPITHARLGAPAARGLAGCPVLLYSPGDETDREFCTAQAEDLASHGYVVVTIDHTYEAPEVVFPGGRVALQVNPQPRGTAVLTTRIADARFVLSSLETLTAGGNPDAGRRALPPGLAQILDLSRTGMFGHSLGGDTAAQVMAADDRATAGIDLDGSIVPAVPSTPATAGELAGEVATAIGGRPFMIMTSAGHGPFAIPGQFKDPTLAGFWANLTGWRLFLTMPGAQHLSYTDYEDFLSQLTAAGVISATQASEVVTPYIGTIAPGQAVAAERAYIRAFFDLQLRNLNDQLLDGPSARYPEVEFLASGS